METKKNIAIIGTVGLPANYGGFETLADHLVESLSEEYNMSVYCSGKKYKKEDRISHYKNARLFYIPLDANGVQSILYDTLSILHSLLYADVLLILGVSGAWILPFVKLFTNKKIIISIDGIEWKRDKWNRFAKMYLFWAESLAVKYSHIDISDNESIQDYTAMRYGTLSRIIEYGADHVLKVKPTKQDRIDYPFLSTPYAFTVCRIEPENNVHVILAAFESLPKHTLILVGNWNNSIYGKELRKKYANCSNIHLLDPIYNQQKLDLLRSNAYLYIHGHSAGGTNPSLVEAMYLGLPLLVFGVSYNKTTTENKAIYFKESADLINIIKNTSFETLLQNGKKMEEIAKRRYTWSFIGAKYNLLINEVLETEKKSSIETLINGFNQNTLLDLDLAHLQNQEYFYEKR